MESTQLLKDIIFKITENDIRHGKWLNTLAMMENTGARKISHYEDPVYASLTELKHAAEEARHAYYLKSMIGRLHCTELPDFSYSNLVAPIESAQYLNLLDIEACRYLKKVWKFDGRTLKLGAYLLVTYSIEMRADMLYGIYQSVLTDRNSKVNVKSIIAEEEGHLAEMNKMLEVFHPNWQKMAEDATDIENKLFKAWLTGIEKWLQD